MLCILYAGYACILSEKFSSSQEDFVPSCRQASGKTDCADTALHETRPLCKKHGLPAQAAEKGPSTELPARKVYAESMHRPSPESAGRLCRKGACLKKLGTPEEADTEKAPGRKGSGGFRASGAASLTRRRGCPPFPRAGAYRSATA